MVERDDEHLARDLVDHIHGAFISGSWLIYNRGFHLDKPPGDIDVVCSQSALHSEALQSVAAIGLVKSETEHDAKYNTDEGDDYELVANYRFNNVNLIVVADKFFAAYKAARDILEEKPALFSTREQRVNLHHRLKAHVREMFGEYAWMKFCQSPVPLSSSELD